MEIRRLIEDYLFEARMLQVATVRDDQPWACTVYFAFDEILNLYWISTPNRRHSEELRKNEKVAGTVVLPHTPGDPVRGMQLQGMAKELDGIEAEEAMRYYAERFGVGADRVKAILDGSDGHLCYRISPTLYVLFDEVNFSEDSRQEYIL